MAEIRVMVTAIGGGGVGEQIIKALRLSTLDYHVIGADIVPTSKGLMEVDECVLLPRARDPQYTAALIEACSKHGADVLVVGTETEIVEVDRDRAAFVDEPFFLPIQRSEVLEVCLDKVKTNDFLASHGYAAPESRRVRSMDELVEWKLFPAVVKPLAATGGSANVFIVQDRTRLDLFAQQLLDAYSEFILQEYVGSPDSEFTVGVLSDMDGHFINSIALRRHIRSNLSTRLREPNHTERSDLGPELVISNGVSQGEIGTFPEVTETCERIARDLGSTGPLNIQCRLVGDKVFVFEINPRFSGTTSLRAMVGFNEPDVLIRRHLLGEDISPRFVYRSGVIMRGLSEVLVDPTRCDSPER